jgi:hypothetical protein
MKDRRTAPPAAVTPGAVIAFLVIAWILWRACAPLYGG